MGCTPVILGKEQQLAYEKEVSASPLLQPHAYVQRTQSWLDRDGSVSFAERTLLNQRALTCNDRAVQIGRTMISGGTGRRDFVHSGVL